MKGLKRISMYLLTFALAPTSRTLLGWLAAGSFTVANFARTFGAAFVINYFSCVIE